MSSIYKKYTVLSSFRKEDLKEITRLYPFHLTVFHKFLEEVIIIPFIVTPAKILKETFPEGDIVITNIGKDKFKLVVILGREKDEV